MLTERSTMYSDIPSLVTQSTAVGQSHEIMYRAHGNNDRRKEEDGSMSVSTVPGWNERLIWANTRLEPWHSACRNLSIRTTRLVLSEDDY